MKPTEKRNELLKQGKTILRPMLRRGGNRNFYVIASFSGNGWPTWVNSLQYKTEAEAYARINISVTKHPEKYIDDRTIE